MYSHLDIGTSYNYLYIAMMYRWYYIIAADVLLYVQGNNSNNNLTVESIMIRCQVMILFVLNAVSL